MALISNAARPILVEMRPASLQTLAAAFRKMWARTASVEGYENQSASSTSGVGQVAGRPRLLQSDILALLNGSANTSIRPTGPVHRSLQGVLAIETAAQIIGVDLN